VRQQDPECWRRIGCSLTDNNGDAPIDEATVVRIVAALGYRAPLLEGRDGTFSVEVPVHIADDVDGGHAMERCVEVDGRVWWFTADTE
jgi:hypothetical protein